MVKALSYIQKSQNDNTINNTNDGNYNFSLSVMLIVFYSIFHLSHRTTLWNIIIPILQNDEKLCFRD